MRYQEGIWHIGFPLGHRAEQFKGVSIFNFELNWGFSLDKKKVLHCIAINLMLWQYSRIVLSGVIQNWLRFRDLKIKLFQFDGNLFAFRRRSKCSQNWPPSARNSRGWRVPNSLSKNRWAIEGLWLKRELKMRRPLSLIGSFRIVNGNDNVSNEEFDLSS